jgi:transketolase
MRNQFVHDLVLRAESDDRIVLVVGDLGYGVVEPFSERFPDRFFNSGVAEQNMMGLAAGLASEGYHVFVYSIANFPIFRCAEQIRNDVCYHNLSVTVVAVGGGLAYGNLGYSHHAVQDYAFMRSLPNMKILSPGDPNEVSHCLDHIFNNPGPSYLRLGKAGEDNFSSKSSQLKSGIFNPIRILKDSKSAVIVTGAICQDVMSYYFNSNEIYFDILTCPIWGMDEKSKIEMQLSQYSRIVTVEDHLLDAGFGSWVLEGLEPSSRSKLRIVGLSSEVCGMVGSQSILNHKGGISKANIDKFLQEK